MKTSYIAQTQAQTRCDRYLELGHPERFINFLFRHEISRDRDYNGDHFPDLMQHEALSFDFEHCKLQSVWNESLHAVEADYVAIRPWIQWFPE